MDRPNLRSVRKAEGLRQEDMAKRLGISLQHYKNIEAGFSDPSYEVLERFSKVFHNYAKHTWEVFQKVKKFTRGGKKIPVTVNPNFIDEVPVKTDWGKIKHERN